MKIKNLLLTLIAWTFAALPASALSVRSIHLYPSATYYTSIAIDTAQKRLMMGTYDGMIQGFSEYDLAAPAFSISTPGYFSSAVYDSSGVYFSGIGPEKLINIKFDLPGLMTSVPLDPADANLQVGLADTPNHMAYFGTSNAPATIVKIDMATGLRVSSLTLGLGLNQIDAGVIDRVRGFAYFCTLGGPGYIVKIRLSDFSNVGTINLSGISPACISAVIDEAGGFAYFGTTSGTTISARILKIRLSDFTLVDNVSDYGWTNGLMAGVLDPNENMAYFGTGDGRIAQVRLDDMRILGTLPVLDQPFRAAVIDPEHLNGGYPRAYFTAGSVGTGAYLVELDLYPSKDTLDFASGDLSKHAYAFPSPFDAAAGHRKMTITNLSGLAGVSIYTLGGQLVKAFQLGANESHVDWDVRNASGGSVPPGTYLVKVSLGSRRRIFKIMVLKGP